MDYITWSKNIYIWVGISFGYDWLTTNYKVNSLMRIKTDCCMLRTVVCLSWNCRWSVMSVDFKSWLLKVKLTSVLMHMCRKGMFYRVRVLLLSYEVHGKLKVWEMSVKMEKWIFNIIINKRLIIIVKILNLDVILNLKLAYFSQLKINDWYFIIVSFIFIINYFI